MIDDKPFAIWPPYQMFYIHSMLFNSFSALKNAEAAEFFVKAIVRGDIEPQERKDELLAYLQNIIIHSGAISRYFFPSQNSPKGAKPQQMNLHKNRATHLRSVFQVNESSPLHNRSLRNAIEHFDERLDLYLEQGIVGHIFPSLILDKPENTEIPHHIFRAFYINEGIFQVLDERYEIQPIIDEISRIHELLTGMDKHGAVFGT